MPNIDMQGALTTDDSITRQELEDAIEAARVYDIAQTNMKSDSRCDFVGTSAPTVAAGQIWHDTNVPGTPSGPIQLMKVYDASGTAGWMGIAFATYSTSTPSSVFEKNGVLWWDKTLILWRVYRDGTYDPTGVAGWHPVSEAYQLVKNESGASIAANRCVVWKAAGTAESAVTIATAEKDPLVAGVTLEAIANNALGVIATVAGGARVDLYVDEAAHALAKGDGIVTAAANAYGRSVGDLEAAAHPAQTQMIVGTPRGCFARALGVTSSNLAPVKLLGSVGTGARVWRVPASIRNYSDVGISPSTTLLATDFSLLASGAAGAQGSSTALVSAKHAPIIAAEVEALYLFTSTGGLAVLDITLSKDGASANHVYRAYQVDSGADPDLSGRVNLGLIPTSIGSGTAASNVAIGNLAFYSVTPTNMEALGNELQILMPSYIY